MSKFHNSLAESCYSWLISNLLLRLHTSNHKNWIKPCIVTYKQNYDLVFYSAKSILTEPLSLQATQMGKPAGVVLSYAVTGLPDFHLSKLLLESSSCWVHFNEHFQAQDLNIGSKPREYPFVTKQAL